MTGRGSAGRGRASGPGCAPSYRFRRSAPVLTLARGDPFMNATFRKLLLAAAASLAVLSVVALAAYSLRPTRAVADHGDDGSVAARLGGQEGIRAFLEQKVVPAVLADPELAPFFAHLTETPGDIED